MVSLNISHSLEHLVDQLQELMNHVLQLRAILMSNAIEIYILMEKVRNVLVEIGNDDPNFIDIMVNTEADETVNSIESLFLEIDELIAKCDEFF